ncbi:MAG: diacylglycerol kinase family protein [Clostridia bacterium]|nr:diacylglycerol kinase family protein [Clostridia bacterium]
MTYLLYNPLSGNRSAQETANLLSTLQVKDSVSINLTEIKEYREFFSRIEPNDTVILCGGDGTLNRFANDTDGIEIACELLYYPIGTGNDFAHDVGYGDQSAPFSVKEYLRNLPSTEINGKQYRFINNVGFGIDGYCCEVGDKLKTTSDKPINYTMIAIKGLLFHFKPTNATVTVDGKEYTYRNVWLAPTMKGRFYGGGMMPTPNQDRNDPDGKVSVMILYGAGKLKTLTVFPSIFKGEHVKHTEMVAIHTGHEISVTFDRPTALQIDGETLLGVTEYRVRAGVPAVSVHR